jgi:hypothetical protein
VIPWLQRTTPDLVIPWLDLGVPVLWTLASSLCCIIMVRKRGWMRRSPLLAVLFSYAWPVHLSIWSARTMGQWLAPPEEDLDDRG